MQKKKQFNAQSEILITPAFRAKKKKKKSTERCPTSFSNTAEKVSGVSQRKYKRCKIGDLERHNEKKKTEGGRTVSQRRVFCEPIQTMAL